VMISNQRRTQSGQVSPVSSTVNNQQNWAKKMICAFCAVLKQTINMRKVTKQYIRNKVILVDFHPTVARNRSVVYVI